MSKNALNATTIKVRIDDGIKDSLCGDVGLKRTRFVPIVNTCPSTDNVTVNKGIANATGVSENQ